MTANQANTSLAGSRRGFAGAQVGLVPKLGDTFFGSFSATSQAADAAADRLRAFAGTSHADATYATTTATMTSGITVDRSAARNTLASSTEVSGRPSMATLIAPMPIADPGDHRQAR